jgi:hypothetical protein
MAHPLALPIIERLVARFRQLPEVEAIAIAGSQATGKAGAGSDIDFYVYPQTDISAAQRLAIGHEFSSNVQNIDYWGAGLEWDDQETGIHIDVIFFTAPWMEEQLARVLDRHEAWLGYTTAFWHTIQISQRLYDRAGWFERLQQKAMQPYPDALVGAIVTHNFPVLRDIFSSLLIQIQKAVARNDLVSLNHRVAALLASYFDILFAINRVPHPGEKRLLDFAETLCPVRPANMRQQIIDLLTAQPSMVAAHVSALVDSLEEVLKREGWL